MTSFSDREQALEAHYAALQLAVFREHFDAAKTVGQHIASRRGMAEPHAGRFAVEFAEKYVVERADMSAYDDIIAEILTQETGMAGRSASGGPDRNSPTPYADRPWVEFVMGQMLLLFGADRAGPGAAESSAPASVAASPVGL
jgi:hypothetical protein